jgi:hypothetical protein
MAKNVVKSGTDRVRAFPMDSTEFSVAKSSARSTEKRVESVALRKTAGPSNAPKIRIDLDCI